MQAQFNLEVPINDLSFGQVSFGVLKEIFDRKLIPNIFPVGQPTLEAFNIDKPFFDWLNFCIRKAKAQYSREQTTIRLWHIFEAEKRLTDKQVLWTAHETDTFTPVEKNIIKNNDVVLFTSNYAKEIAEKQGLKNVDVCPNFFDEIHLSKIENPRKSEAVNFSLIGKFEKRKHTAKILSLWAKMFGKNEKYRLNCLINNPFIEESKWGDVFKGVFPNGVPWNINFIPRQVKNGSVNELMNACDIDLSGLSGAEGFNLPCFNMLALNKICVVLDAHAHKDFIEGEQVFKVEPSGKEPIYDGMFFIQGMWANQGNMYSFEDEAAEKVILEAVNFFESGGTINSKLREKFSVSNTVDKLLSYV